MALSPKNCQTFGALQCGPRYGDANLWVSRQPISNRFGEQTSERRKPACAFNGLPWFHSCSALVSGVHLEPLSEEGRHQDSGRGEVTHSAAGAAWCSCCGPPTEPAW